MPNNIITIIGDWKIEEADKEIILNKISHICQIKNIETSTVRIALKVEHGDMECKLHLGEETYTSSVKIAKDEPYSKAALGSVEVAIKEAKA